MTVRGLQFGYDGCEIELNAFVPYLLPRTPFADFRPRCGDPFEKTPNSRKMIRGCIKDFAAEGDLGGESLKRSIEFRLAVSVAGQSVPGNCAFGVSRRPFCKQAGHQLPQLTKPLE